MIRRKVGEHECSEADALRLVYVLKHEDVLERICAQIEAKSAEWQEADALAAAIVGEDNSPGWREVIRFIMDHWTEILQLIAIIVPLLAHEKEES